MNKRNIFASVFLILAGVCIGICSVAFTAGGMSSLAYGVSEFRLIVAIIVSLLVALVVVYTASGYLTKNIAEKINNINIDEPLNYIDDQNYKEIKPLLEKINKQRLESQRDKSEIEKTSLIRQEFTANVSHELKTPLHSISGYAELLENGLARPCDVKAFAGQIRTECKRLTELVEDIIELSKLDGGARGEAFSDLDLYKIADNVISSLSMTASEKGVNLHLEGENALMKGIPHILHSILYNLCDNAIKYNSQGGYVYVTVRPIGTSVQLVVSDTGIGIPKDDIDRIFERFYRVDKSRSQAASGTGLGLSIVKHGAKAHEATVDVKSTLGEGTTFTLMFPTFK